MRRLLLLCTLHLLAVPAAFAGETVRPTTDVVADVQGRDAFLQAIRAYLAANRSEIGKHTLEAIDAGTIEVDTLDRLSVSDCRTLLEENPRQWSAIVSVDECVDAGDGRAIVPKKILSRVSGFQNENRIYVRAGQKIADAAATVVHEVNHVANRTHDRYTTEREILEEEYRAYYVGLLFQDGRAPSPAYLGWLKSWIAEQYALKGVAPASLPDVPTGILDNVVRVETPIATLD